ncbi:MAG: DMT family transporter [Cyanobacteriota bacterium]
MANKINLLDIDLKLKNNIINWGIFITLALVWGSSFKLMKIGMIELTSYQVASLRILSAGLIFLPVTVKNIHKYNKNQILLIVFSGLMGNFIPSYLFCIAETNIDSSLAGMINSLMPTFVVLIGLLFFNIKVSRIKIFGIIISFIGLCFLLISKVNMNPSSFFYVFLAILATVFYAVNSNLIVKTLKNIKSLEIISIAMSLLAIPALLVLISTNYFNQLSLNQNFLISTGASIFLGIFGTALASGVFYVLIKRTGSIFASSVTNIMPIVAIFWGFLGGENLTLLQIFYFFIIMSGVYLTSKK